MDKKAEQKDAASMVQTPAQSALFASHYSGEQ